MANKRHSVIVLGLFAAVFAVCTVQAADTLAVCNAALGKQVFALCSACHTVQAGEPAREGPSLVGVFGQTAGTNDKLFKYSPALVGSKWQWDTPTLDKFLTNPRRALPGTIMTFVGLKIPEERAAVACYLQQVSSGQALPNDPLDPIATDAGANAGPLSGALLVTRDLSTLKRAYVDGVGLSLRGPLRVAPAQRAAERTLWGLPADLNWDLYLLSRESVADSVKVLVMVPDRDTPAIRATFDREETGPYALGFAMRDVRATDARITALGLKRTLPAVNEYPLQRRDGTPYPVTEASYEIGDHNRLVILQRGDGLQPVGHIDPATGLGGPSYSSLIVDDAAAMEHFFTEVLDYERRTSREWTVFQPRFRYITLHARGAHTGNLGLVEYDARDRHAGTGVAARPPNRGLAGWSFPVKRLDEVLAKAQSNGIVLVSPALRFVDPRFGHVRMATVLAPNGFLIELYEN